MEESILKTIKKLLGIADEYEYFDADLIVHINSTIMTLSQLGLESAKNFEITGKTETWGDLLRNDTCLNSVKTYLYLKVKLLFDPPSTSSVLESYEQTIRELEWRINVQIESP